MNAPTDGLEALLAQLPPDQLAFLGWQQRWLDTARPQQIPPEDGWTECGFMAGRGFGKTRVGAEWLGRVSFEDPQALPRCVVAPTQNDVRFTCFEGVSGLLNVIPPECVDDYSRTDLVLTLTNGATIRGFSAEKADRLRGPEHADAWCFIAGTIVATPDGGKPIEALRPSDLVLTREGPRRVLANAEREAPVGSVSFSNGQTLVGTADHPVYTSRGWTSLSDLSEGDEVCAINAWSGAATAGTATAGGTTSGAGSDAACATATPCTALSGGPSTARSQTDASFTTSTTTASTTGSRTLPACRGGTTAPSMSSSAEAYRSPRTTTGQTSPSPAPTVETQSSARPDDARPSADRANSGGPRPSGASARPARSVAGLSCPALETSAASVVSTWRPEGRQSVYCLKVEGEPEYFANDILVHNCDEIAAWGKDAVDTFDMLQFGLRIGPSPRVVWTSTPKPVEIVRQLTSPKAGRIIVRGATFDNKANLSESFIEKLAQYEGTKIGRQELYGELLDPEEAGVIRRSWFRLWPHTRNLPKFQWIIMSLDTAYTEKTLDKRGDPDPTACGVWGVFEYKGMSHIMLLDCWEDHLGLPDLMTRVKRELNTAYGDDEDEALIRPMFGSAKPITSGRKPDILIIEEKGSGISLRQSLERAGISAYAYNPGRADKLSRLHIASPIFAQRRVWLPESPTHVGKPRTWCEGLVTQLCTFAGDGSIRHDDHVDQTTQAIRVCMDKGLLKMVKEAKHVPTLAEDERRAGHVVANPYAQ